jgi:NADH-quinone oxidoreductase subunit N
VYEGAPKMVSVLFMTVPKIGILSVMLRVLFVSFEAVDEIIRIVLMILGIVSVIWGTVCALRQEKIKRFLAYSTVGHIGYIMFGLSMGSRVGVESVLIYMIIYMITSLNI